MKWWRQRWKINSATILIHGSQVEWLFYFMFLGYYVNPPSSYNFVFSLVWEKRLWNVSLHPSFWKYYILRSLRRVFSVFSYFFVAGWGRIASSVLEDKNTTTKGVKEVFGAYAPPVHSCETDVSFFLVLFFFSPPSASVWKRVYFFVLDFYSTCWFRKSFIGSNLRWRRKKLRCPSASLC